MATLPALPYDYDALEPYIDKKTMMIHHTKHHQAYIDNLNKAVQGTEFEGKHVHNIIVNLEQVPQEIRGAVRNNGGGHSNHSMFWQILCPSSQSGQPSEALMKAINEAFGSFDAFKEQFAKAAMGRFGSGWAWLSVANGQLIVENTPNQDSPISQGRKPILGLDVWEHAYYLRYQNKRAEYVNAFWNIVNWAEVSRRFEN